MNRDIVVVVGVLVGTLLVLYPERLDRNVYPGFQIVLIIAAIAYAVILWRLPPEISRGRWKIITRAGSLIMFGFALYMAYWFVVYLDNIYNLF